jgi:hypothetical protein
MHPAHTFPPYFAKIHPDILCLCPSLLSDLFPSGFLTKIMYCSSLPWTLTYNWTKAWCQLLQYPAKNKNFTHCSVSSVWLHFTFQYNVYVNIMPVSNLVWNMTTGFPNKKYKRANKLCGLALCGSVVVCIIEWVAIPSQHWTAEV